MPKKSPPKTELNTPNSTLLTGVSDLTQEVGYAVSVKDFIIYLDGLPHIRVNEIVENDRGVRGWVNALYPDSVEILLLDAQEVKPGELFRKSYQSLSIDVGKFLLGRAINPLGIPVDGKSISSKIKNPFPLDRPARGLSSREFINKQLDTGITIVDSVIPIGRGQRELVLGDARSGKTTFLVDLITNQKQTGVICIYTAIGKPITEVRSLIDTLEAKSALANTVVVAAPSTESAPLIYLAPQTAFAIAEYFESLGEDVLVILDDMGNHAKIHREISLLGKKSPGREAYPGDIFYQHAHILERAGNFKKGGSITAIPVIELNLNDFTGFIPTNLMAMTDGHLLFRSNLYNQGQRPAIDISLSVTRVGRQTQNQVQNLLGDKIKSILAQASQLETVSRFSGELSQETQDLLSKRVFTLELLAQESETFVPKETQAILLSLVFTDFIKDKKPGLFTDNIKMLTEAFIKKTSLSTFRKSALTLKDANELIEKVKEIIPTLEALITKPVTNSKVAVKPKA